MILRDKYKGGRSPERYRYKESTSSRAPARPTPPRQGGRSSVPKDAQNRKSTPTG